MRFKLTVNGLDITSYVKEDGIDISYEQRNARTLETMDGVKHYVAHEKLKLSVSLLDHLWDDEYYTLANALKTSPASITYNDFDSGEEITGYFYVLDKGHKPFRSFAGTTLINDGKFTLEEK